jgi:hypothetical protein
MTLYEPNALKGLLKKEALKNDVELSRYRRLYLK